MSRCFPFPPPGYDKKIPFDYDNLIKKEEEEKKHKKDKRDKKNKEKDKKEKKDKKDKRDKKDKKGKHKKEKERSEDDQREKKDSTEELKDNNKHRETSLNNGLAESGRHRGNELKQASVENDTAGPLKYNSPKNLGAKCAQSDDTSEFEFLLDSRKSYRNDIKVKDSPLVQKINLTGKRNSEASGTVLKDKRGTDQVVCGQSEKVVARSHTHCSLPSYVDGKKDGQKDPNREKKSFDNGKPSPFPKVDNKASNLGKRKALEMNDLLHEKESQPNKLPRFHPPSNHVSDREKNLEPCMTPTQSISKFAENVQNDRVSSKFSYNGSMLEATEANIQLISERQENCASYNLKNDILSSHLVVQDEVGAINMCYASKQFDSEKLQTSNSHNVDGQISLHHPVVRNGKAVDEAVTNLYSRGEVMIDDRKVYHNDPKINGLEVDKKPNVSSTRPSSKNVKKNGGTSARPPHPDSKYLSEILSIPSVEWPDMDNKEWLFSGSRNKESNKPTSGFQVAETKHVWSEALWIESADVTALPYVIPY